MELLWCPPLQLIEEIQQKRRVQIRFLRSRGSFHRAEDTTKRLQMRSLYRGGNLTVRRFCEELVVCPRKYLACISGTRDFSLFVFARKNATEVACTNRMRWSSYFWDTKLTRRGRSLLPNLSQGLTDLQLGGFLHVRIKQNEIPVFRFSLSEGVRIAVLNVFDPAVVEHLIGRSRSRLRKCPSRDDRHGRAHNENEPLL